MQPLVILKLLVLLTLANGAPVVAKKVLGRRLNAPLDGGLAFLDGRPLFGASKTARGLALSVLSTTAAAPILGIDWTIGAALAAVAMAGDLFSSFVKRRLGLPPGGRATVLDQIPESLFPLLACREALSLTAVDILVTVLAFFVGEILLSRLLYRIRLRERPY
jgi:CDP-2,3-bis-(O-geranylgeranyl)-sn-glycerol synthase